MRLVTGHGTAKSKFLRRTARNFFFRREPYFVHLAVTHRCNLRGTEVTRLPLPPRPAWT
jgi:hypothetical protein